MGAASSSAPAPVARISNLKAYVMLVSADGAEVELPQGFTPRLPAEEYRGALPGREWRKVYAAFLGYCGSKRGSKEKLALLRQLRADLPHNRFKFAAKRAAGVRYYILTVACTDVPRERTETPLANLLERTLRDINGGAHGDDGGSAKLSVSSESSAEGQQPCEELPIEQDGSMKQRFGADWVAPAGLRGRCERLVKAHSGPCGGPIRLSQVLTA